MFFSDTNFSTSKSQFYDFEKFTEKEPRLVTNGPARPE